MRLRAFDEDGAAVHCVLCTLRSRHCREVGCRRRRARCHLKAALILATARSVKASTHNKEDAASFAKIDRAVEQIRKAISGFEQINTSASTAKLAA